MRFGLLYEHQLPRPWTAESEHRLFKDALAQVELADQLGIDHIWEVEHHFLEEYAHSSAPEVFLAACAARTTRIRIGHGVVLAPPGYNHPARVAERIATLDLIADGRVDWGTGESASRVELEGFGIDPEQKKAMWAEAVEQTANMMAMSPYPGFQGKYFSMPVRNVVPKPLQKPHPPIHISIGSPDSSSARLAASRGWGIISGPNAPTYSVASHWKAYAETCAKAGRAARGENWRISRNVIVAPTEAEAHDRVFGANTANRYFFTYLRTAVAKANRLSTIKPRPDMSDEEFTPDVAMAECAIYGSPKTVLDRLVAFRDRVGPFGTLLKMGVDWGGASEAWEREAMRLLAHEVMPKFRQHVMAQAAE